MVIKYRALVIAITILTVYGCKMHYPVTMIYIFFSFSHFYLFYPPPPPIRLAWERPWEYAIFRTLGWGWGLFFSFKHLHTNLDFSLFIYPFWYISSKSLYFSLCHLLPFFLLLLILLYILWFLICLFFFHTIDLFVCDKMLIISCINCSIHVIWKIFKHSIFIFYLILFF